MRLSLNQHAALADAARYGLIVGRRNHGTPSRPRYVESGWVRADIADLPSARGITHHANGTITALLDKGLLTIVPCEEHGERLEPTPDGMDQHELNAADLKAAA